jgi:hypothetical protein
LVLLLKSFMATFAFIFERPRLNTPLETVMDYIHNYAPPYIPANQPGETPLPLFDLTGPMDSRYAPTAIGSLLPTADLPDPQVLHQPVGSFLDRTGFWWDNVDIVQLP